MRGDQTKQLLLTLCSLAYNWQGLEGGSYAECGKHLERLLRQYAETGITTDK